MKYILVLALCLAFLMACGQSQRPCDPSTGCVLLEEGANARWWPDSWIKGTCQSQSDIDWLVTYNADNHIWGRAEASAIRFYTDRETARNKIRRGRAQINDPVTPGITLCLSGRLSEEEVNSVWIWLNAAPISAAQANAPTESPTLTITLVPTHTPIPTLTPTPTVMATSVPEIIESGNPGTSIIVHDPVDFKASTIGKVQIKITIGGVPTAPRLLEISEVTQDITKKWTLPPWDERLPAIITGDEGIGEVSLPPGTYAIWTGIDNWKRKDMPDGNWGIVGSDSRGIHKEMLVFPILAGKVTEIKISLARLEIGLISTKGNAMKKVTVYVSCQGKDIAGKNIKSERCVEYDATDHTGLVTFDLAAGTYVVSIAREYTKKDVQYYDIHLKPDEVRRTIFDNIERNR